MHATAARPAHSVIVLSIPDATARLLEHVADTRGVHIGEMAAILLQLSVLEADAADRAEAYMAKQREPRG